MRVLVTGGTGYLGSELVRRGADGAAIVARAAADAAARLIHMSADVARALLRTRLRPLREVLA